MTVAFRQSFPTGMLAALAMIAGLEFRAFRPRTDLATFIAASWIDASRASRTDAVTSADVLFLGDSQIKGGLIPSAFAKHGSLRAYNLATIGGQPAASLALLKRALDSGAKPKAIVFGFYPGLLASDSGINVRQWPELLGLSACVELLRIRGDFGFAAPLLSRCLLPSLRRRDEIRVAVFAMATGTVDPGKEKALAYLRNWRLHSGAQALAANPDFRDDPVAPQGEPGRSSNRARSKWSAKNEHLISLRAMLALADSRGIATFWLLPTNSPGLQTFRRDNGLETAFLQLVHDVQHEYPKVTILDPTRILNSTSVFSDACHLARNGALALSLATAATVKSRLACERVDNDSSSRWVVLADQVNRSRYTIDLQEDVIQSIHAIHADQNARKLWR